MTISYEIKPGLLVNLYNLTTINGPARIGGGDCIIYYHFPKMDRVVEVTFTNWRDALIHKSNVQMAMIKGKTDGPELTKGW